MTTVQPALRIIRDRRNRPPISATTGRRLRRLIEHYRVASGSRRARVGKVLGGMGFDVVAADAAAAPVEGKSSAHG